MPRLLATAALFLQDIGRSTDEAQLRARTWDTCSDLKYAEVEDHR